MVPIFFHFESLSNFKFASCQKYSDKKIWEEESDTPKKSETMLDNLFETQIPFHFGVVAKICF